MKRHLATILVGDVVGYSALMEADEEGTATRLHQATALARGVVAEHEGRIFKLMGDAKRPEAPREARMCSRTSTAC